VGTTDSISEQTFEAAAVPSLRSLLGGAVIQASEISKVYVYERFVPIRYQRAIHLLCMIAKSGDLVLSRLHAVMAQFLEIVPPFMHGA
jgi:hypothetical protein